MNGNLLIDTNIIIYYASGLLKKDELSLIRKSIDDYFLISIINKIELLGFQNIEKAEEELISKMIGNAEVIELTDAVADLTISIRKDYKIQLPDAIIAASAIHTDSTVVTNNMKDLTK